MRNRVRIVGLNGGVVREKSDLSGFVENTTSHQYRTVFVESSLGRCLHTQHVTGTFECFVAEGNE